MPGPATSSRPAPEMAEHVSWDLEPNDFMTFLEIAREKSSLGLRVLQRLRSELIQPTAALPHALGAGGHLLPQLVGRRGGRRHRRGHLREHRIDAYGLGEIRRIRDELGVNLTHALMKATLVSCTYN